MAKSRRDSRVSRNCSKKLIIYCCRSSNSFTCVFGLRSSEGLWRDCLSYPVAISLNNLEKLKESGLPNKWRRLFVFTARIITSHKTSQKSKLIVDIYHSNCQNTHSFHYISKNVLTFLQASQDFACLPLAGLRPVGSIRRNVGTANCFYYLARSWQIVDVRRS